ncbi:PHP domain-like protein, partial [Fistulina hepatica ATCC 64428]
MYFDLYVPVRSPTSAGPETSKKGKGKGPARASPDSFFSAGDIAAIETRIELLVHLGYTVLAFTQTAHKKVDGKSHINVLNPLLARLRPRPGIVYLKRLNIVLDDESEKGFGLTAANATLFNGYDIIGLVPTTQGALSLACLTHSQPSSLTAHIISVPLTLPRLPYRMKHTLVRTALKNGVVFEIMYAGAIGDSDPALVDVGAAENGGAAKRNWWASARELVRVTKGKGLIVSSGVHRDVELRAPRDIGNIIILLGLAQNAAHDASTNAPKSLIIRAQTRKTYRAVLSDPKIVIP